MNVGFDYFLLKINFGFFLMKMLPQVIDVVLCRGFDFVLVISYCFVVKLLYFLQCHTNCLFKLLTDITAVDYLHRSARFEVVYHLLSLSFNTRIRVKTTISSTLCLSSVTGLFNNACWCEREIWDMFGLFFFSNTQMYRLLTDYGFIGYPLRKDFPLVGFFDVAYSMRRHCIVHEYINNLNKKKNYFNEENPWCNTF